jgi:N6-adenosine-specific RNA methylase IME4
MAPANLSRDTFRQHVVDEASASLRALRTGAGEFPCILADPPWHHVSYSIKGQGRSPSRYYDTMTTREIAALPVGELAAKSCHLFLWTTQPHLEESFSVLKAWGFRYSSVHTHWLKLNPKAAGKLFIQAQDFSMAMGFTTRKNVEYLLLGRRGSPVRLVKNQLDWIMAARRQHSRKPDVSFVRVEQYCPGPRLELFSRAGRDGWTTWGKETEKFTPPPAPLPEREPAGAPPATALFPEPA